MVPADEQWPTIEDLEAFEKTPENERPNLTTALRAVLAETAVTGVIRYEWKFLKPLLLRALQAVVFEKEEYAPPPPTSMEADVEIGPPRLPAADNVVVDKAAAFDKLKAMISSFPAAPFTIQRLCEICLEPTKQYHRLDKLIFAIEKLLNVTTTLPITAPLPNPPPEVSSILSQVNENPISPYANEPLSIVHLPMNQPINFALDGQMDLTDGIGSHHSPPHSHPLGNGLLDDVDVHADQFVGMVLAAEDDNQNENNENVRIEDLPIREVNLGPSNGGAMGMMGGEPFGNGSIMDLDGHLQ